MQKLVYFSVILLIISTNARGQYLEIGPQLGGMYYLGDINPGLHFGNTNPGFGFLARYNPTTRWGLRAHFLTGKVGASDADYQVVLNRNLSFESDIMEISFIAELNFLTYFTGSKKDYFSPYIFGGLGIFTYSPEAEYNGQLVSLQELRTEGQGSKEYPGREIYSTTSLVIPFGIGVKYSLTEKICLAAEWGLRKTYTDYLDDISQTYYIDSQEAQFIDIAEIMSDPTQNHDTGMQRGNPAYNDWYGFAGIIITYKIDLSPRSRCNDFKNIKVFR